MSPSDDQTGKTLVLDYRRISRTPQSAIKRYTKSVERLYREDYEQAMADWPQIIVMRERLARHITDGLLCSGRPVLHRILSAAIAGYVAAIGCPRRARLLGWLYAGGWEWASLPYCDIDLGYHRWRWFAGLDLSDALARSVAADIVVSDVVPDSSALVSFVLAPWPELARDLGVKPNGR